MTTTFTPTPYANRGMCHRRPRRSLVPLLAPLAIWAGAAGVLALWWSDTNSVVGPAGRLTGAGRITGLLAGGVGITLLRTLFETLPGQVTLIYRARRGELDAITASGGATVRYIVDEPAGHSCPLTARTLSTLVPDLAAHDVYLCGLSGMTEAAIGALREAGVPARRIHHESFAF